jgi:hypothetical protein
VLIFGQYRTYPNITEDTRVGQGDCVKARRALERNAYQVISLLLGRAFLNRRQKGGIRGVAFPRPELSILRMDGP